MQGSAITRRIELIAKNSKLWRNQVDNLEVRAIGPWEVDLARLDVKDNFEVTVLVDYR